MKDKQSELNAKIYSAFFKNEDSDSLPNFTKNRDNAWMLIHKLEELGHRVITQQFPPVSCMIDEKISYTGNSFNDAVCSAAIELIEQLEIDT